MTEIFNEKLTENQKTEIAKELKEFEEQLKKSNPEKSNEI